MILILLQYLGKSGSDSGTGGSSQERDGAPRTAAAGSPGKAIYSSSSSSSSGHSSASDKSKRLKKVR